MFKPINKRTAYKQVENQIREAIISQKLKFGERLPPEHDLAKLFNVSRTTIREAIRSLERSGLVSVRKGPGQGIIICDYTPEAITDNLELLIQIKNIPIEKVMEARILLEGEVARLAAERATKEQIKKIERSLTSISGRDIEDETERSLAFHLSVAEASQNELLLHLVVSLKQIIRRGAKQIFLSQRDSIQIKNMYHIDIFNSIKNREPELAKKLMIKHIASIKELFDVDVLEIDMANKK
ncbi:MAG: FadR family transcriptional regulator [Firmicutes bacterium]|nr:FadR family transcriptional regulator [Bacillota bacterium]